MILVVDDQEPVRLFVTTVLERHGYLALVAASGEEAIEIAKRYAGRIDMLVSDLQMPPGMTGIQLGRHLIAHRPELKVLLMSGVDRCDVALPSGWRFVAKPFAPSELLDAITNTFRDDAARAHCA